MLDDLPDLDEATASQDRALTGDAGGVVVGVGADDEVAADGLFCLGERTIDGDVAAVHPDAMRALSDSSSPATMRCSSRSFRYQSMYG